MNRLVTQILLAAQLGLAACGVYAQSQSAPRAKEVVLASLAQAAAAPGAAANTARPDALAVSVLTEGPLNMLVTRSVEAPFSTGDKFRIKLLSPRDGEVAIFNTPPVGETSKAPIWRARVKAGVESVSNLMQLTGNRGVDQLHVVLLPSGHSGDPFPAFQGMMAANGSAGKSAKDIRLVTENTNQGTYFYNPNGQGGFVTIHIRHQ
ncbi:hypothetical protein [Noviherbaspirillum sedimenti]|uniref:Uncharacterized protein n=1 Tax=Noviherbaspirillum sedimenti TaxID=2320865 RepID=A0A3A3FWD4_9BURK|nr:hypothetical protein [Noviherbaspirillum sedimenti]RJG00477.1 hypothetical protein D3878_01855 [Noviherbaspirillum sedimenti]